MADAKHKEDLKKVMNAYFKPKKIKAESQEVFMDEYRDVYRLIGIIR